MASNKTTVVRISKDAKREIDGVKGNLTVSQYIDLLCRGEMPNPVLEVEKINHKLDKILFELGVEC